jgi:hypothetical protein
VKPGDLFESFHRFPPRRVGEFGPSFEIPKYVFRQGRSINVLYRSDKTDPETLKRPRRPVDYIHDHKPGVFTYLPDGHGRRVATPSWIRNTKSLELLGQCLGFQFENPDGENVEAQGKAPLPELYSTANGKALIVVQGKRKVLALIWGGKLDVEPRGIVG